MNEVTRSSRIASAIQVIQRMNGGMSVSKACREVGLPRSSFYAIISREQDALVGFQDMVVTSSQEQLLLILTIKTEVLKRLIREALAETTSPRDRLAIFKALTDIQDELAEKLRLHGRSNAEPTNAFTGPSLVMAKSRFTAEQIIEFPGDDYPVYTG